VHLRRALLLFALVLGLTALATAVAPAPPPRDAATVAPPAPRPPVEAVTTLSLTAPAPGKPPVRAVRSGAHVVLDVQSAEGGEASIPALGRTESVAAATPARFDLLVPGAGRYDVLFTPALGSPARIGTLVSRG
jgi:hypothetical protein